jgi:N-acetylneuraminic acid mutarotase
MARKKVSVRLFWSNGKNSDQRAQQGRQWRSCGASPFEGLAEKINWLKRKYRKIRLVPHQLKAGLSATTIKSGRLTRESQCQTEARDPFFDALEDMNAGGLPRQNG